MTQAKSKKQLDLRSQFNLLEPKEQEAVINFFNLHNAAIWIFTSLSQPAVDYVNLSIKLSQEKIKDV